jgi:3-deoxy-D-manno-octulosonic acid kinase
VNLSAGYQLIHAVEHDVHAFAHEDAIAYVETALQSVRLHEWAARQKGALRLEGRGAAHSVPAPCPGPDRAARWVVRHYRRGGAIAPLLGDRYARVGELRPVRELRASVEARARGVPTPAVVAGAVYPVALFYRADLVTELVADAVPLADVVFRSGSDATGALLRAGRLVHRLEEARVFHSDLNARNVLVGGVAEAWAVDLDACRVLDAHDGTIGVRMRKRLERSLKKLAAAHARPLTPAEWDALRCGMAEAL